MTWQLTITDCHSGSWEIINAREATIQCDIDNQIEQLDVAIDYNIEGELSGETGFISGEVNSSVVVKLGALIDLTLGTESWFNGHIYQDPSSAIAENRSIRLTAYDPKYKLRNAQAPVDGNIVWAQESPKDKLVDCPMIIATGYNVGESRTYFPSYTAGAQFDAATYLGVMDRLVADGGATMVLGATNVGFPPRGFVIVRDAAGVVNREIRYYNGYFFDGANWILTNCVAEQLGLNAALLLPNDRVYYLNFKEITQDAELLEAFDFNTDYQRVPYSLFSKAYQLGGFTFNKAIYNYDRNFASPPVGGDNVRGTYYVYDETDANVLLLEDIIETIVTAPVVDGGAGFVVGDLDFDALNIPLNKFTYDARFETDKALSRINNLFDDLQLNMMFYWQSVQRQLRLKEMTQKAIPDIVLTQVKRSDRERNMDELFTHVRVIYQDEDNFSSLDPLYFWHPSVITVDRSQFVHRNENPELPDSWFDEGNTYSDDPIILKGDKHEVNRRGITRFSDATLFNTWGGRNVMDDKSGSTLTAWWNKNYVEYESIFDANHEWHHSYYWFTADAEIRALEEIKIQIGDNRLGDCILSVYGASNFDPGSADPTINVPNGTGIEWYAVSPELTRIGGKAGDTDASFDFSTEKFTQPVVNILRITYHELSTDSSGIGNPSAIIADFFVRAGKTKQLLISLTDNIAYQYNPEYVYAPETYNRLACVAPIVDQITIGKASDQEAMILGRERLLEALRYYEARQYVYDRPWTQKKPEIGDTIQVEDLQGLTYTGLLTNYVIRVSEGDPNFEMTFELINYDANYLGYP